MKNNRILPLFFLLICGMASLEAANQRPNIILIMVDDIGYECIGAYGGTSYRTPHIDQMASKGILFRNGYSQPLCTPSRVQIMTGKYNVRNYIGFGKIDETETTFGNLLRDAGYKTCIVGKWQLGADYSKPYRMGFDTYCLWNIQGEVPSRYHTPEFVENGVERKLPGGYGPDFMFDFARSFIDNHKQEPFFLYYPMMLVHSPFEPTPDSEEWEPYPVNDKVPVDTMFFADMVQYMDNIIGKLVHHLDSTGLSENTIIIITGDNGTNRSITSVCNNEPVQGGKGLTTEAGTHVPLIAYWPGTVPAGLVLDDLVDFSDILPTLCDLGNATIPLTLAPEIDGISFYPRLKGETGSPREYSYCWYEKRLDKKDVSQFIHNATYKLYITGEFYNTGTDILEENPLKNSDLTPEEQALKERFRKALDYYSGLRNEDFTKVIKEPWPDQEHFLVN